jgi:glycosyltransferase involved in cell wall biosynthesis
MSMRLLTVFKGLSTVHLDKDVGVIPRMWSQLYNQKCIIIYTGDGQINNPLPSDCSENRNLCLYYIGKNGNRLSRTLRILRYLIIHSKQYDYLNLYHELPENYLIAFCSRICSPKSVVFIKLDCSTEAAKLLVRPTFINRLKLFCKKILSGSISLYLIETRSAFTILSRCKPFKGKLFLIPNGFLQISGFQYAKPPLNRSKDNLVIWVGRAGSPEKNCQLFLESVCNLKPSVRCEWQFIIAGATTPNLLSLYSEIREKYGLKEDVIDFLGNINSKVALYALYQRSKILCITSRTENFPLVVPEALFFGNVILSTPLGFAHDLQEDGAPIVISSSFRLISYISALEQLLVAPDSISESSKLSEIFAREHLLWSDIIKRLASRLNVIATANQKQRSRAFML